MTTQISEATIGNLRQSVHGDIITPKHADYEQARKVWNGSIDRRPACVIKCKSVGDVRAAVAFGQKQKLAIAVRSGGHSMSGQSVADDALVIDLRPMNKVTVDPQKKLAVVQGGAVWGELDGAAQAHGLATTGGHVTHTGVAGLTLGGGVGHLMRNYGLAIDNLVSAELVTADGRVLRASATENEDLFWAIRGGGGNFGIATEFEFKLHALGTTIFGGLAHWPADKGPELMKRWAEFCKSAPDEVTTILAYLHAPPFDFVPKDVQLKPGYGLLVAGTDIPKAEAAVKELRAFGPPWFDIIGPMPYLALQGILDPALPHGTRMYLKGHCFDEMNADVIKTIHENTAKMPPGHSQMICMQLGGAVARVPVDAMAFPGRKYGFQMFSGGVWDNEAQKPACVQWSRDFYTALKKFSRGTYVNFADDLDEAGVKNIYGADKYAKLQRIKAKYDPENVFHLNQNIKPAK
jgi:FAD/FMN-containing dehydrogenase